MCASQSYLGNLTVKTPSLVPLVELTVKATYTVIHVPVNGLTLECMGIALTELIRFFKKDIVVGRWEYWKVGYPGEKEVRMGIVKVHCVYLQNLPCISGDYFFKAY